MARRPRRARTVRHRASPRPALLPCRDDEDIWTEIAKHLDGKSLVMLATANKWFNRVVMQDIIWKRLSLQDLGVKDPGPVGFKWNKLYTSAFDKTTYKAWKSFLHVPAARKTYDWMRIGPFRFDSPWALLVGNFLTPIKIPQEEDFEEKLKSDDYILLKNVKTGVWIADLQHLRCPDCDLGTCEGSIITLDARHMDLFLSEGFQNGNWEYEMIGTQDVPKYDDTGASGEIFDIIHLSDSSISKKSDHILWMWKAIDWQLKTIISEHKVAVKTILLVDDEVSGVQVKYHVMKAGNDGEVVSIRISLHSM